MTGVSRTVRAGVLAASAMGALARGASAQSASASSASAPGAKGEVLLQIRPQPGDTLHLRLEQRTVTTASRRHDSTSSPTPLSTMTSEMRVFSTAIVEDTVAGGTIMRTITDSVQLSSSDARHDAERAEMERAMRGQTTRFRIAYDGTIALLDTGAAARDLSGMAAIMPGAFPMTPLAVGGTWVREMPLPGAGRPGARGVPAGWLHARFRLDSLSKRGAHLSMRGEMSADPDPRRSAEEQPALEDGVVTGTLLVDRRRGWLTESQVSIVVHAATRKPDGATLRFETRVTQRMRTSFALHDAGSGTR